MISAIMLLAAAQGMFSIRGARERAIQRREAVEAVADARNTMREEALAEARAQRQRDEPGRRRRRPDEWLDGRRLTITGAGVTASIVVLGGLVVGLTFARGARRRNERAMHQRNAIGASPPDWLNGTEAKRTDAAPLVVDR